MIVFGGWNGHDTMDDIYHYSFGKSLFFYLRCIVSNNWYEIRRVKGIRPPPRYRHSAVVIGKQMIVFGGVDIE